MTQLPADPVRHRWFKQTRAAALGFGLGASLALSPLVWAQNPTGGESASPPAAAAPAVPQHSFAPLVKRVLPAVVNISVTEKSDTDASSEHPAEGSRGVKMAPNGGCLPRSAGRRTPASARETHSLTVHNKLNRSASIS